MDRLTYWQGKGAKLSDTAARLVKTVRRVGKPEVLMNADGGDGARDAPRIGIKGWVKIQPFTQETEGLLGYPEWWLGRRRAAGKQHPVAEAAVHGAMVVARLRRMSTTAMRRPSLKGAKWRCPARRTAGKPAKASSTGPI